MLPSKELSCELRKLSGWDGEFTLGYLLRKLLPEYGKITLTHDFGHEQWWATDVIGHAAYGKVTPEDALCKLAIELFKQGILK